MGCCCCVCKKRYIKGGFISLHPLPKDEKKRNLWVSKIMSEIKDFKATNNMRICSRHFTVDSFDINKLGGRWLRKDAIPTLFELTNKTSGKSYKCPVKSDFKIEENMDCHKDISTENDAERESGKEICYMDTYYKKTHLSTTPIIINVYSERSHKPHGENQFKIEENESTDRDFNIKRQSANGYRYIGDFKEDDMHSPTKAVLYYKICSNYKKKKEAELRLLRDSNRYLKKRVASLKQKLQDIQNKGLIAQAGSSDLQLTSPGSATKVKKEIVS